MNLVIYPKKKSNKAHQTEAHNTLCFDSYNDDEVATSQVSTWVLLDRGADATPGPSQSTP